MTQKTYPDMPLEPLTVSVEETKRISDLGITKIYELIGNGTLLTTMVGKRRLIYFQSVKKLLGLGADETSTAGAYTPGRKVKKPRPMEHIAAD